MIKHVEELLKTDCAPDSGAGVRRLASGSWSEPKVKLRARRVARSVCGDGCSSCDL